MKEYEIARPERPRWRWPSARLRYMPKISRSLFIDPLSGPFAATGNQGLAQYKFAAEELVNKQGGVLDGQNFEIVAFDNKISPKESLIQLQVAIDQGIRFIAQGNSSGVANALTDAINKHNRRNPDNKVIFLNYAAVDPALTNDKCKLLAFPVRRKCRYQDGRADRCDRRG